MNIVIEGLDNAGKSTLARRLSAVLRLPVVASEGPEQFPGELAQHVDRYLKMDNTIFDRHPCVSDPIYSLGRKRKTPIPAHMLQDFYASDPLFIYCRPNPDGLKGHVLKAHDTASHVDMVEKNYTLLEMSYEQWAKEEASLWYRLGDSIGHIIRACHQFDPVADIEQFHGKFGQFYAGKPRALPKDLSDFRRDFMDEELGEYVKATRELEGALADNDLSHIGELLALQLDALIDLTYVVLGTAHLQGFNFKAAWARVHAKNMEKVPVARRADSTRHSLYDIVKPAGWTPPDHSDLVADHAHTA